jgi:hypothetical protein
MRFMCQWMRAAACPSRTEDAAFRQIERKGGTTTSVVALVTALTPDFSN